MVQTFTHVNLRSCINTSLVPRPSASSALLTFDLARDQKSGGGSGEFYHVSDVKGREKVLGRENLIGRGRPGRSVLKRPRMQARIQLRTGYG